MHALLRLTTVETRLFLREPVSLFLALAFAPLLLVILGLIPALREPDPELGGMSQITIYVPILVAMGVTLFSLSGLAPLFAAYRERGILRRMRTTPVTPATMLTAQLVMATLVSLVSLALVLPIARLAFAVELPQFGLAYLFGFLLLATSVFAIGLLVAAVAPSSTAATAIGTLLFFPLAFFAGIWLPRSEMPGLLLTMSDLSPLGAGVQSLQDAADGSWPQVLHVIVLLAWTIVAGGLAARFFRWG